MPEASGIDLSPPNTDESKPMLQGTRLMIFKFISDHPGTHLREIGRALGLGMGDLQYNMYVLEKQNMITYMKRGLRKFVFISGAYGDRQSALLSALSTETQRQILAFLARNSDLTHSQITRLTGLTSATITWHMKRLLEQGLVDRIRNGRSVHYHLLVDATEIEKFVRSYHPSFWENLSNRLADIVLELSTINFGSKD